MLGFISRLVREFKSEHGYRPSLFQISPQHFNELRLNIPEFSHRDEMARFPGMRILFGHEAVHPHVVWSSIAGVEPA